MCYIGIFQGAAGAPGPLGPRGKPGPMVSFWVNMSLQLSKEKPSQWRRMESVMVFDVFCVFKQGKMGEMGAQGPPGPPGLEVEHACFLNPTLD